MLRFVVFFYASEKELILYISHLSIKVYNIKD